MVEITEDVDDSIVSIFMKKWKVGSWSVKVVVGSSSLLSRCYGWPVLYCGLYCMAKPPKHEEYEEFFSPYNEALV
jgi:hypothetical protein